MRKLNLSGALVFGLPLLLIVSLFVLTRTSFYTNDPSALSPFIIIDLLVTMPVLYYLLIRTREVPKFTIVSVLVIGLIAATYILPESDQELLSRIKLLVVPGIEIGLLGFIIFKTRATIKAFKENGNEIDDFFTILKTSVQSLFTGIVGILLATEIAVVYYSLVNWKRHIPQSDEYTYHRNSGIVGTVYMLIGLVMVEIFVGHYLLLKWNETAAWIATFIGVYSMLQIVALLKSMSRRLIRLAPKEDLLYLRYGFFNEVTIPITDIERIELSSKSLPEESGFVALTPLGILDGHNIIIHCHSEHVLDGFYGRKKRFQGIGIYVDSKTEFVNTINTLIN